MGTQLKNEAQVRRYLMPKIQQVVEYVLDKIYEMNRLEIDKIVYAAYNPSEYERTYEFRDDAWSYEKPQISGIHVKGEFKYDPSGMVYDASEAQHGSPTGVEPGDAREYLAEIIYGGAAGMLFGDGPWCKKRDAWDSLVKDLKKKDLRRWMKMGFESVGLNVKDNKTGFTLEK